MLKWTFFTSGGGEQSGFHDPGVETFKGNLDRFIAREAIQNSLDAREGKKPVLVKFSLLEVPAKDIPDIATLVDAFERCADYCSNDPKAVAYFKRAAKLATAKKIFVLRISDFNTTGVIGGDNDRNKNWYSLVRSMGSSSKSGGEGGSFGIGKNAPFAASQMRTVFYSTHNKGGEHAFQGIAKLVSHERPDGEVAQATVYLGGNKGASVRAKGETPAKFRRAERGTDVSIIGFAAGDLWKQNLVYSVLDDFWPAIHWGDLEVEVDDIRITKNNLQKLLDEYSTQEDFDAHIYYQAYTSPTQQFGETLTALGEVSAHLLTGDDELPKRVAMIRRTGMVIYRALFRAFVPFCGVFICKNKTGNGVLRDMEPPRHDAWDPDLPDQGKHKKTSAEFLSFLRDCIKKLAPADAAKVLTVPELSQFLPDDESSPEEEFAEPEGEKNPKETFDRTPAADKIPGRKIEPSSPRHGGGTEKGKDTSKKKTRGKGGKPTPDEPGPTEHPPIPLRSRAFPLDIGAGLYTLTVEPTAKPPKKAKLYVYAVGDQGKEPIALTSAEDEDGKRLKVRGKTIGPVKLATGQKMKLAITLQEPQRLAVEVEAYEAE